MPLGRFARSVVQLTLGTTLGQLLILAAMPFLSRLYSPADLGIFGVFSAIESILVAGANLRYEQAIPLPESDDEAARVLALSLLVPVITGIALLVLFIPTAPYIAEWLDIPSVPKWLWLLPIALVIDAWNQALLYWNMRVGQVPRAASSRIILTLAQTLSQITLGLLTTGPIGLMVGWIAGRSVGTIALMTRSTGHAIRRSKALLHLAIRYWRFAIFATPGSFINSAALQLPSLLLAALYSPQVAGLFLLANRVVTVPVVIVGQSIAQVYIADVAPRLQTDRELVRIRTWKISKFLLLSGAVPLLSLAMLAPTLFRFAFGERWIDAGEYARVLAFPFMMQLLIAPFAWVLHGVGRQHQQLAWDSVRLGMIVLTMVLIRALGWSAAAAVSVYAVVLMFTYLALGILINNALRAAGGTLEESAA